MGALRALSPDGDFVRVAPEASDILLNPLESHPAASSVSVKCRLHSSL